MKGLREQKDEKPGWGVAIVELGALVSVYLLVAFLPFGVWSVGLCVVAIPVVNVKTYHRLRCELRQESQETNRAKLWTILNSPFTLGSACIFAAVPFFGTAILAYARHEPNVALAFAFVSELILFSGLCAIWLWYRLRREQAP